MNTEHTLALLQNYQPTGDKEKHDLAFIIDFVKRTDAFTSRHTPEAHLTASAWVTNGDHTRAVLLHHKKLDIWVQPGGHIDDSDESLQVASLREAEEETGLSNLQPVSDGIFDVDIHEIPARKSEPAHLHLDIRFWFETPTDTLTLSDESHDLAWFEENKVADVTTEESILRMVRKSLVQD